MRINERAVEGSETVSKMESVRSGGSKARGSEGATRDAPPPPSPRREGARARKKENESIFARQ